MELHIEVTLADTLATHPARWKAAVQKVMQVARLQGADLERCARDGVLSGTMSSERLLALVELDEVKDFQLDAR